MRLLLVIFPMLLALTKALPYPIPPSQEQSSSTPVQQSKPKSQQKQFTQQEQQSNQNDQAVVETQLVDKDTNFVSSSILDNPSYDANMYSSFIPQDAIQQYVNHFGGGGGYAPYTASVFPPQGPFAVQTGYEGFLVPDVHSVGTPYADPFTFLKGLIPKFLIAWLIKSATVLISTVGVVFFGAAVTTAVCTLTPLCSISFSSFPLFQWRNTAEAVGKAIGSEITPDRIRRTVEFVRTAIDKFNALQNTITYDSDDKTKK